MFLLPQTASSQDLFLSLDGLVAYYDFEQTGTAGLANRAPGLSGQHDGTYLGDVSLIAGAGAGFSGNAAYPGAVATNTTDRSLLVGNVLNVAKANTSATAGKGQFQVSSLTSRGPEPTVAAALEPISPFHPGSSPRAMRTTPAPPATSSAIRSSKASSMEPPTPMSLTSPGPREPAPACLPIRPTSTPPPAHSGPLP